METMFVVNVPMDLRVEAALYILPDSGSSFWVVVWEGGRHLSQKFYRVFTLQKEAIRRTAKL